MSTNQPESATDFVHNPGENIQSEDWMRDAARSATLAPSSHNSQPWSFRLSPDNIELHADRSRGLPIADPNGRELTISCGAALFHLRLAFLHAGHEPIVELSPNPNNPDLLARVTRGAGTKMKPDDWALYAEIPRRRTNRHGYERRIVPDGLPIQLQKDALAEGAWFQIIAEGTRDSAVRFIEEGDRLLWSDKRYREELASWIHPIEKGDGLVESYRHGIGPKVVRAFNLGRSTAKRNSVLAEEAPMLGVLGTKGDDVCDWLAAGQALARVLLRASAAGLDSSFLNQPIQVPEMRPKLARSLGRRNEFPQMVARMGDGPMIEPSPRRPLEDVLID